MIDKKSVLALALLSFAFGRAHAANDVLGTYQEITFGDHHVVKSFTITKNEVIQSTVCGSGQDAVRVEVKSPAQVESSYFNVLTSGAKTEMFNGQPCVAELKSGVVVFGLQDGGLFLTPEGGQTRFFGFKTDENFGVVHQLIHPFETTRRNVILVAAAVDRSFEDVRAAAKAKREARAIKCAPPAPWSASCAIGAARDAVHHRVASAAGNIKTAGLEALTSARVQLLNGLISANGSLIKMVTPVTEK